MVSKFTSISVKDESSFEKERGAGFFVQTYHLAVREFYGIFRDRVSNMIVIWLISNNNLGGIGGEIWSVNFLEYVVCHHLFEHW